MTKGVVIKDAALSTNKMEEEAGVFTSVTDYRDDDVTVHFWDFGGQVMAEFRISTPVCIVTALMSPWARELAGRAATAQAARGQLTTRAAPCPISSKARQQRWRKLSGFTGAAASTRYKACCVMPCGQSRCLHDRVSIRPNWGLILSLWRRRLASAFRSLRINLMLARVATWPARCWYEMCVGCE
jgi:hypothetical protein